MLAAYSPEVKIENGLRKLECSGRNFVEIAKQSGVKINTATFSNVLSGKEEFRIETAERLLEILAELERLQDSVLPSINWANAEKVIYAMTFRKVMNADPLGDLSLEPYAQAAANAATTK